MPLPTIRWTLKQLAIFIAILAVSFAILGVSGTVILLAIVSPPLLARPGHRLASLYWVVTCFPVFVVLSIYVAWLNTWFEFGQRPDQSLGRSRPMDLCPMILFATTPFALLGSLGLMVDRIRLPSRAGLHWAVRWSPMVIVPTVWVTCFVFLRWDPFGAADWYMD